MTHLRILDLFRTSLLQFRAHALKDISIVLAAVVFGAFMHYFFRAVIELTIASPNVIAVLNGFISACLSIFVASAVLLYFADPEARATSIFKAHRTIVPLLLWNMLQTAATLILLLPALILFKKEAPGIFSGMLGLLGLSVLIWLSVRLAFVFPLIVLRAKSLPEALGISFRATAEGTILLGGRLLLLSIISFAGVLLLCVGALVTVPVCMRVYVSLVAIHCDS